MASGTCTLRAAQSGNANYLAAANVDQSFTVSKASQTITFGALANKAVGDPAFTITATASSGLAVTFASLTTTICSVSSYLVIIWAAGTCTIRASQTGNATYAAAPNVSQSFVVTKGSQRITFAPIGNVLIWASPFDLGATASSGLPVAYASLSTTICAVSGATVTLFAMGTCTIRASQPGDANYLPAPNVDQSFTVSLVPQTITFFALSNVLFGVPPQSLYATADSGLPVAFSSLTPAVCTVAGNTATLIATGTCTIRAAQTGNATYAAAPDVDRSFRVAIYDQYITFLRLPDRAVNVPPFNLNASASSGLPVAFSSLTASTCAVGGNTATLLTTGTCTIRASQDGNSTYLPAPNVDNSFAVTAPTAVQYFYDAAGNLVRIQRN